MSHPRQRRRTLTLASALSALALSAPAADYASAHPAVRVEYWQKRVAAIDAQLADKAQLAKVRLVFLGDSITDFWLLGDSPWVKGQMFGRAVWDETFAGADPRNLALDLGVSGDRTEHVLERLLPRREGGLGELDPPALDPDFVVLMLGINNTFAPEEPEADTVFEGVRAVITAVHQRKPRAEIVLQSVLPTNDEVKNRDIVRPVNDRLRALAESPPVSAYVHWLDLYPAFVDADGKQVASDFNDGLHPTPAGYRIWRDRLVPFLDHLRADKSAAPVGR